MTTVTVQNINIGNLPNDGTGDDLRSAFVKVNNNFNELDSRSQNIEVDAFNLGTSASSEGLFYNKTDNTLNFKSLQAGTGISLSANSSTVTIDAAVGISDLIFTTDSGSVRINEEDGSGVINFEGGPGIVIEKLANPSNDIRIRATNGVLQADTAPKLSANLDVDFHNITRADSVTANNFYGDLTGLVHGIDVRDLSEVLFDNFDFGDFQPSFSNILEYIIFNTEIDFGEFSTESAFEVDLGTW